MCNRFRADPDKLPTWREYAGYEIRDPDGLAVAAGEVFPKYQAAVVRTVDGHLAMDAVAWGFEQVLPGKRPGTTRKQVTTNVRNLSSAYWRSMLANPAQRCLVPFTSFAEPVIGGGRACHWFSTEREVACFAGIWRPTEIGDRFAFLTVEPNPLVAPLHPKAMPVILAAEDELAWLTAPWDNARQLVAPYPSQLMAVA